MEAPATSDKKRVDENKKATDAGAAIVKNAPGTSLNTDDQNLSQYLSDINKNVQDARTSGKNTTELETAAARAKKLAEDAQTAIKNCLAQSNQQSCESQVHELYNQAKVASRLTAYQTVQAGVPNTCAKIDFGIQPFITAGNGQREFLCNDSTSKKVLRTYDLAGNPTQIQASFDLNSPDNYPDNIKKHVSDARKLVLGSSSASSSPRASSSPTSNPGAIYTTVSAAKDACKKLVNTKWNDSTNKCQVDCGTGSSTTWNKGQCVSNCPSNTDSENVSGVGKYCTTGGIYPFPIYQK